MALLNGPHGEADRAAFERWYQSDPEHARAYDKAAAWFEVARKAERPRPATSGAAARPGFRARPVRFAVAAAAVCVVLLAFVLLSARTTSPLPELKQQFATFSADGGGSRRIILADGSEVLLSPDSSLDVAIGRRERRLWLIRGEGRFSVAHEDRPFIVAADGTEVVARGTQFVVRLGSGRTIVSLIEGRVDVAYAAAPGEAEQRRVTRLRPGQQLVVEAASHQSVPIAAVTPRQTATRQARTQAAQPPMLEFDNTRLGEAVELVNRHARIQIRLGDPSLAALRVTGAFRSGDAAGFAEAIAAAFTLEVERDGNGTLWLHPGRDGAGDN